MHYRHQCTTSQVGGGSEVSIPVGEEGFSGKLHGRLRLQEEELFLTMRAKQGWTGLPGEGAISLSLEDFKPSLGGRLSGMVFAVETLALVRVVVDVL